MPMPGLFQIAIPVVSVTHIKKTKTAILVPNALVIATANDRVRGKEWNGIFSGSAIKNTEKLGKTFVFFACSMSSSH